MAERGRGRRVQFDERSRNFPIRALIAPQPLRSYTWRVGVHLDQGSEGACVGFSWAHELAARPAVINVDHATATAIYFDAQRRDPWPGGAYPGATPIYEGTSVLAGAQACHELGYFREYRWAFGLDDLVLALGYAGPAVLGLDWHEGMFEPAADGQIKPIGAVAGGHAILAYQVQARERRVWLWNSWGRSFGLDGACWMSFDDLGALLASQGEACIPVSRRRPAAV